MAAPWACLETPLAQRSPHHWGVGGQLKLVRMWGSERLEEENLYHKAVLCCAVQSSSSTKSMYWINHSNSTNSTIERFDIESGNLNVITADATHVSGIHLYITSSLHHHYSVVQCDHGSNVPEILPVWLFVILKLYTQRLTMLCLTL